MSVWDQIREVEKSGKDPTLTLTWSMCKRPEAKKPGRPKKEKRDPTLVEQMASPLLGDSTRPRCLNPRCRKRLKADQTHVCGESCCELALMHYQAVVDLLKDQELPVEDIPDVRKAAQSYARRVRVDGPSDSRGIGDGRSHKGA